MSLHLKLLDIDHPLSFEESKLRQIDAHALINLPEDELVAQQRMKQLEINIKYSIQVTSLRGTPDFRDGDHRLGGKNQKTKKILRASTKTPQKSLDQKLTLKILMPNSEPLVTGFMK